MPNYVKKTLQKYNHIKPIKIQGTPYQPAPRKYGPEAQETPPPDDSPLLDKDGQKYVQQVVGSFLYYARAVDPTILYFLSQIAT